MNVIVDTNIFFSAMLKSDNELRNKLLMDRQSSFYTCYFLIVEILKYKDKIVRIYNMEENEILQVYYSLLKQVELYNETLISKDSLKQAYDLCKDIDMKDIPFVALTIELNGNLWTGDKKLKQGLTDKGFDSFFE